MLGRQQSDIRATNRHLRALKHEDGIVPNFNLVFPVLSRKRNKKKKIKTRNLIEVDIIPPDSAAFLTPPLSRRATDDAYCFLL